MNPLSNTTNEALAFVFSTRSAVVADVAPEPRTCKREVGVVVWVPIPTNPLEAWMNNLVTTLAPSNVINSVLLACV